MVRSKSLNLSAQGNVGFDIHQPYAPGQQETFGTGTAYRPFDTKGGTLLTFVGLRS